MARGLLLAAAAATCLAVPAEAAPTARPGSARPAPARDWTKTVVVTPQGGFRMGNPAAPVKLVEYGSLTCPHCAHFSTTARAALEARVRTGRLSFEFRNYILNGTDVAATLISRCAPPATYFRLTESLYATQPQWVARIEGITIDEKLKLSALPDAEMYGRIADIAGLTQLAASAGVAPQRAKACLADKAGLARIDAMNAAAGKLGVHSTPTFFVNGRMIRTQEWADLEPLIRQAGG
ncbi:protein-disulfide isomerase [Sphingomonas parva]|uniref:Protein-disulfide isomerase n=1 Tax=Sphingomonas parva TaxID=2555898 RepID=A0A4Y8ZKH1_9SPHN|nr:thioredoxin domain-containing protein [Sphingomonas parva]TFI56510.1 protein-disulfide isomerase [Sphingomonas parva]